MCLGELYTSDKRGNDETGDGSKENPFKTVLQAMRKAGKEPFPTFYSDHKELAGQYDVTAKSQLKKIIKIWSRENEKAKESKLRDEADSERRLQNIEEAKKIIIKQDASLPEAKYIKIVEGKLSLN